MYIMVNWKRSKQCWDYLDVNTSSDVLSWSLFFIIDRHKTNCWGGFDLFGTMVSRHRVHIMIFLTCCYWKIWNGEFLFRNCYLLSRGRKPLIFMFSHTPNIVRGRFIPSTPILHKKNVHVCTTIFTFITKP